MSVLFAHRHPKNFDCKRSADPEVHTWLRNGIVSKKIERLEAKFKLGQDEPRKDALAVADRLSASRYASHRQLGDAVRQANIGRTD